MDLSNGGNPKLRLDPNGGYPQVRGLRSVGGMMLKLLDILRESPQEATIGEFVALLERMVAHDECRWCGKPISSFKAFEDSVWLHNDIDRSRGCHAATFDDDGWDDSVPKRKYATPKQS